MDTQMNDEEVSHTEPKRLKLERATDYGGSSELTGTTSSHSCNLPNAETLKILKPDEIFDNVKTAHFIGKISQAVKLYKQVTEEPSDTARCLLGQSPIGLDWSTLTKEQTFVTAPMPEDIKHILDIWNIIYKHYIETIIEKRLQNNKGTPYSHIIWKLPETNELEEVSCNVKAVHNETLRTAECQIDAFTDRGMNSNVTQGSVNSLQLSENINNDTIDEMLSIQEEIDILNIDEDNYTTNCALPNGAHICIASQKSRQITLSQKNLSDHICTFSVNIETNTVTSGSTENQSSKKAQVNRLDSFNETHQGDDENVYKQLSDTFSEDPAINSGSFFVSEIREGNIVINNINDTKLPLEYTNTPIQKPARLNNAELSTYPSAEYCSQENRFNNSSNVARVTILGVKFEENNAHASNNAEPENILISSSNRDITPKSHIKSMLESVADISAVERDINLKLVTGDLCEGTITDETYEVAGSSLSSGFSTGNIDIDRTSPYFVDGNNTQCDLVNKNAMTNKTLSDYHISKLNSECSNSNVAIFRGPLDKDNVEDLNSPYLISRNSHKIALGDKEREKQMCCHETDHVKVLYVSDKDNKNDSVTHTAGSNSVAIQTCKCLSDLNLISICSSCIDHSPDFSDSSKRCKASTEDINSCEMEGLESKLDISCARQFDDVDERNTTIRQKEMHMEVLASEISAQDLYETKDAVREKSDMSTRFSIVKYNNHCKDILAGSDNLNQERHGADSIQNQDATNSRVSKEESKHNAVNEHHSYINNTEVVTCEASAALRKKDMERLGDSNLFSSCQLSDALKYEICIYKYDNKITKESYYFTKHKDITKLTKDDTNDNIILTGSVIRGSCSEVKGMPEPGLNHPLLTKPNWLKSHPDDSLEVREAFIFDKMDAHVNAKISHIVPIPNSPSETPCTPKNNAAANHAPIVSSQNSYYTKTIPAPANSAQSYQEPPINVRVINTDLQECITDNAENDQCCNSSTMDPTITEDILPKEACEHLGEKQPCFQYNKLFTPVTEELEHFHAERNEMNGNELEQTSAGPTKDYFFIDSTPSSNASECSQEQEAEATLPDAGHFGMDRKPRATLSTLSKLEHSENVDLTKGVNQWKSEMSYITQGYYHQPLHTDVSPDVDASNVRGETCRRRENECSTLLSGKNRFGTLLTQQIPKNKAVRLRTSTGLRRLGLSKCEKINRLHPNL